MSEIKNPMSDLEMLQVANQAIAANMANATSNESLGRMQRLQSFVAACTQTVEALGEGVLEVSFRFLANLDYLSHWVSEQANHSPEAVQALRDYLVSIPGYSDDTGREQGAQAKEHHGFLMMKLSQVMPWPRTFVDQLASDLRAIELRIDREPDTGAQMWLGRSKTLIEACLGAASVLDEADLPATTGKIASLAGMEQFAKTVQQKSPSAAEALWRYLLYLPGYEKVQFGRQPEYTSEKHLYLAMQVRSVSVSDLPSSDTQVS